MPRAPVAGGRVENPCGDMPVCVAMVGSYNKR